MEVTKSRNGSFFCGREVMRRMPQRSKTYYRYLIPYVALLLAAVLALALFSQFFFVAQLKERLLDVQRSRLGQTVQQLDSELQQIYTIDYQLSSVNENFLSYYLSENSPMRDLRLVNEFKNLLAPSTFIAEIALVEQDNESVYTSTAVYSRRLFFDSIYAFDDWPEVLANSSAQMQRTVWPASSGNDGTRYIVFINRPSVFSRLRDAVQMYFVEEAHFLSWLAPEDAPGQQGAIWDSQGRLIASTLLDAPVTGDRLCLDGVQYLVLQQPSTVLDWCYTFLLPENIYLEPIHRAQMVVLVFMLVLLALGALLIHFAMKVSYRPLQELTLALGGSPHGDELESLRDVVDSLSKQNERMRSQLMCSPDGQALKDALLFSLLKGKFSSFECFNQEARALDMTFDSPCYQVLMLRSFDQEEVSRPKLSAALDQTLGSGFPHCFRDLFEPSMIVCLVGLEQGAEAELTARCHRLLEVCAQEYGLSFTIGMSECYQDIGHISAACFEATQAVREYFTRGRHQLIAYRELNHTLDSQTDYLSELRDLPGQSPTQQLETIRRFIDTLVAQKVPSLLAKSYCNSALQLLISSAACPVRADDLFAINYLRTVNDYLSFVEHMLQPEPERPDEAQEEEQPVSELLARIYAYVAENYDDCNFSLQDAADKLGLSSSYLSQYFKQQTGDTLTSYVAALRIRKACSLLETTTMPLQIVSESIGYYNLISFIRRFKQITGVTPGEWRRAHQ